MPACSAPVPLASSANPSAASTLRKALSPIAGSDRLGLSYLPSIGTRKFPLREKGEDRIGPNASPVLDWREVLAMTVRRIAEILEAKVAWGDDQLDLEVCAACGADLMSDVMAFVKEKVVLLTGLVNPQAIRTADLLDIRVVVFVRGKSPTSDIVAMARENGMVLLSTKYSMFLACGRLYEAGLRGGGVREIS
jgi:hypothetical protein